MGTPIKNTRLLVKENRIMYPTIDIRTKGYTFLDLHAEAKTSTPTSEKIKNLGVKRPEATGI
ncbi:MAG TPA: hypothetical protein DIU35_05645 [Candidatus Latescibacteria bacterium]|nr:hypothetical protein [Candidatus Latescibacterota bacterium]|tara:strand:- start:412 stop:597 length:186 start_codon:yes stop_codon:yes gene_type:complete